MKRRKEVYGVGEKILGANFFRLRQSPHLRIPHGLSHCLDLLPKTHPLALVEIQTSIVAVDDFVRQNKLVEIQ